MKKAENLAGLVNVFNELEKQEFTENELDSELGKLGVSPNKLAALMREKLEKLRSKRGIHSTPTIKKEFDPFLLAAGKKSSKKGKMAKKPRKKP